MQSLSETIQPEDNSYRPPHIKYQTPKGFDLMDIMAFAEHGQPYDYFHTLREQAPVAWWQPPADIDVAGFWSLSRYEDVNIGFLRRLPPRNRCCRFLVAVAL